MKYNITVNKKQYIAKNKGTHISEIVLIVQFYLETTVVVTVLVVRDDVTTPPPLVVTMPFIRCTTSSTPAIKIKMAAMMVNAKDHERFCLRSEIKHITPMKISPTEMLIKTKCLLKYIVVAI